MVWAPVFTIIMLLLFRRYGIFKLMRDECRLAADSHGAVRVDLAEPRVLRAPGVLGGMRLQVLIIVVVMLFCPAVVVVWFLRPGISALYAPLWGGVAGVFIGIALELLVLSGWIRFGLGAVLLDERKLVVPNLITKRVYTPEGVRIWCSESSSDAYTVLVVGACGARSLLYVNEQSVRDLGAWIGSG